MSGPFFFFFKLALPLLKARKTYIIDIHTLPINSSSNLCLALSFSRFDVGGVASSVGSAFLVLSASLVNWEGEGEERVGSREGDGRGSHRWRGI